MEKTKHYLNRFYESKVAIHTAFVTAIVLLNLAWWLSTSKPWNFYQYVLVSLTLQLSGIYTGRWLYKGYFYWPSIWRFVGYATAATAVLTLMGLVLLTWIDGPYLMKYTLISLVNVLPAILLGMFATLTRSTLKMQINQAIYAQQQKESELLLLHSQLSPHFLFNTLNNLYGMSLSTDKRISNILLKLSDLLRYSLYETKNNYVPLANEIAYIDNYIELERIRIGDRLVLSQNIQVEQATDMMIAPMLFIVFLENAFKHSKNTYSEKIYIDLYLSAKGQKIHFHIKNSYSEQQNSPTISQDSGLGISNAVKRLELLYPNSHQLDYSAQNGYYSVDLKLETK